jgi:nucleotide-binding universal stress UspA family protein
VIAMSKKPAPLLKNILVGTDFSVCAARAFSFAVSLAASQGAKIHILHVLIEPVQAFDVAGALPYLDVSTQKEWEDATKKRLTAAVASAEKRGVSATSEFHWGRPSDVLVETAVKTKASLVVLGTHGRNALEKLLIGSTAERVVRLCPVPVLTVREKR